MKRWIHASKDYKKLRRSNVNASTSFDVWYDSLSSLEQENVDCLADDMGLPLYEECSEAELTQLHDLFVSNKGASYNTRASEKDYLDPDLYVIKIWHEVAPGRDKGVPVADEEIFEVYATDPQDAIEQAKQQWSGPIDRIEIVAINPEVDTDEELPFI